MSKEGEEEGERKRKNGENIYILLSRELCMSHIPSPPHVISTETLLSV